MQGSRLERANKRMFECNVVFEHDAKRTPVDSFDVSLLNQIAGFLSIMYKIQEFIDDT